jgi:hypothetical protein
MDIHAFSLQTVQLTRERNCDDKKYCIISQHLKSAPDWTYKTQNMPVDTDFSGLDTLADNLMMTDGE